MANATKEPPAAEAKTEDKPVERGSEPLWSRTGLLVMVAVWVLTLGLGIGGVMLFSAAPSATEAGADEESDGPGRAYGMIERVQVSMQDSEGQMRTVTFNLLLDFGPSDEKSRAELEQANFKQVISYRAEDRMREYTVRQVAERSFPREFGESLEAYLNEIYARDGKKYVHDVLVQNLTISG